MTRSECSFAGCGRPHYARTLCHTHYTQHKRGKPLAEIGPRRGVVKSGQRATTLRDEQGRKLCIRCGLWSFESDFIRDASHADGLSTYCKPCRSAHARAWRYGLEPTDVERMVSEQGGACAVCPARLADGYCIDHDHACCPGAKTCGKCLRGLLCQECNKLLGKIESDPNRLDRMLAYIGR